MRFSRFYLLVIGLIFAAFTVVFDTFPRSTFSPLEKRDLATFPKFSFERLLSGAFTKEISTWFSDSEPYRDHFMQMSMETKHSLALSQGENNVTFHASSDATAAAGDDNAPADPEMQQYENHTADENAKISNAGIIVTGSGKNVRALMAFGGSSKGCVGYAQACNLYQKTFGKNVQVYCLIIPTAVEYYCPEQAKRISRPQFPNIKSTYALLDKEVKSVDAYTPLGQHAKEDIYLRTDHHWAPLGGYYAAEAFAKTAGVPFKDLSHYERKVLHRYVGSMYGYAKDIAIKNAPEDFVYYVPKNVAYTTTYTDYQVDKNYRVTAEGKPHNGAFFQHYRDGHPGAYCTFMGSDQRLTVVRTSTPSKRRLLILKDSFGNALPGYLFFSFGEIHVVDSRYFLKNMKNYVTQNKITDILFANNIFKAYSPHIYKSYLRFLSQSGAVSPAKSSSTKSIPTTTSPTTVSAPTSPATSSASSTSDTQTSSSSSSSSKHSTSSSKSPTSADKHSVSADKHSSSSRKSSSATSEP